MVCLTVYSFVRPHNCSSIHPFNPPSKLFLICCVHKRANFRLCTSLLFFLWLWSSLQDGLSRSRILTALGCQAKLVRRQERQQLQNSILGHRFATKIDFRLWCSHFHVMQKTNILSVAVANSFKLLLNTHSSLELHALDTT
ncbi:unnamed protein product [Protopolystoma xenopodis]|uniref:Uncharacterized protein n=1 Tax=Protopolystoma xenopodis TaxID=117903 RepID=A0A448WK76_9PLAT|nr:unnamed protein product [Protopolystoma xenopodis]